MIGVLTYDKPHRKTYDALCLLKTKQIEDVIVYGKPFHYHKTFCPLYEHRPAIFAGMPTPQQTAAALGYRYEALGDHFVFADMPPASPILVCGAGIIPDAALQRNTFINAHPGYIPNVRGLDALKWAIYEGQPIGVTTHVVGDAVDAGLIIERNIVPVYYNDTFHAVAQRQYEMEVSMLVEALDKIALATLVATGAPYPVHRRMPHAYETRLLERFHKLAASCPISDGSRIIP